MTDTHICEIPVNASRRHWWTCDRCGQIWRRDDGLWRMTMAESNA